jgi:ribonuclease Z
VASENRYIHNALKQVRLQAACSSIHGFSISGLATYLQFPEMNFCVDMGECPLSATPIDHVFLTHAHGDHARCIMRHNSLRKMMGVERDSVYYVPESIYEGAKAWIKAEALFEGVGEAKFRYPEIEAVRAGERIPLRYRKDLVLEPFEVRHSVPAMGATVYLHKKKLRDEFLGKSSEEIIELRQKGVEITREVYDPQLSFMGDCMGESLLENPDVFKSKVLVTECTFLDNDEEQMAHKKGHTHLKSIVHALKELGNEVKCEQIVLTHFSMKYSEKHIMETIASEIPEEFLEKVVAFI